MKKDIAWIVLTIAAMIFCFPSAVLVEPGDKVLEQAFDVFQVAGSAFISGVLLACFVAEHGRKRG